MKPFNQLLLLLFLLLLLQLLIIIFILFEKLDELALQDPIYQFHGVG